VNVRPKKLLRVLDPDDAPTKSLLRGQLQRNLYEECLCSLPMTALTLRKERWSKDARMLGDKMALRARKFHPEAL
jgi:hypothetical protein